jgi:hypothetical protein
MNKLDIPSIFQNAFESFKVFETIPISVSGILVEGHSSTIWQILNHLILLRAFQIQQLSEVDSLIDFDESESWIKTLEPASEQEWNSKLNEFKQQTVQLNQFVSALLPSDLNLNHKLKIIQESSIHLSFHLGEIILIARQKTAIQNQVRCLIS